MLQQITLKIKTKAKSFHELTSEVGSYVSSSGITAGLCHLFIQHTSASLLITENADPDVRSDLENYFSDLVSESRNYIHSTEGKDDMPAHIRSVLTQTSLSIPVSENRLQLGTWQGIYLWEHRDQSYQRKVMMSILGE